MRFRWSDHSRWGDRKKYSQAKFLLCIAFLAIFGLISVYFSLIFGFRHTYCFMLWSGEGRPPLFLYSSFLNHFMREADGVGVGNLLNVFYSLFLTFLSVSLFSDFPVHLSWLYVILFYIVIGISIVFIFIFIIFSIVVFPQGPKFRHEMNSETRKHENSVLGFPQQSKWPDFRFWWKHNNRNPAMKEDQK